MEYKVTTLPKSELEIVVIITFLEFEPHVKRAAVLISEEAEIEGFRKGKAPYDIVKNKFGEQAIYEKAAEIAVRKTYPEVLEKLVTSNQLLAANPPVGRPEITITKLAPGNELQYKVKLALLPEVKLPDYKSVARRVKKEKKEVLVSDEEVEKTLKWVRESRAVGEGENRKIPELTDDFAKSLGDFPSVDALRSNVRSGLQSEKEERERERIRIRILEEVAKDSGLEVPDVLVESELEKMFAELKSGVEGMGAKWEDYLVHLKKTPEELRSGWREDAIKRVRAGLVLREIARAEKIEPGEEEIQERADAFLRQYKSAEDTEKNIDAESLREYTRGILRNEKVFEFLEKQ
ncbi:MAG: hypothetical protein HYW91_01235 [Candidatus Sungbacteria bacterium]|nr:hypothetical protein [Candidatus Sungbacteria bacterium]